ncbi:MAG: hypothetical protein IJ943_09310 [Akkermansia sp.]|nr:hypothetical protein [Akkermansia sp.]
MNTHKEQDRSFWARLKDRLAAIVAEAGAAQDDIDEYSEIPPSAVSFCRARAAATSISSCRTSADADTGDSSCRTGATPAAPSPLPAMNETTKQKILDTIAELKFHLAGACTEVADAQEALEKLPSQIFAPVSEPPPYVLPSGADEYRLTLTAAQLVALSRAVENELLPFVRHVYEDDSSTYRTTLIKVFQAIREAERALPTGPRAIHIAPLTPATEPHALRVEGYDPEFTPDPENFGTLN